MKSDRAKLRIAGVLFLSAFLAYGIGAGMVTGIIEATIQPLNLPSRGHNSSQVLR